ncbi:hypothetical protein RIF29_09873 [Crotalaria pallida]|uniref:Uncharacterized protein n=1 Tax=Crotalaria pallida TaxID=3830 RepID=A0AAN9II40_CROPI
MVDVKRQTNNVVVAITTIITVLAKRVSRLPRKLKVAVADSDRKPKKLVTKISRKTSSFGQKKSKNKKGEESGDGGVWQKGIMMGDKCVPLNFSGVIYYDSKGKQVNEIPIKSPGANAVTGYFIRRRQRKL